MKGERAEGVTAVTLFFELPENWKDTIDEIFTEGGSDVEAFVALGLTKDEHNKLLEVEEYEYQFDNGMAKSEAFWLSWARANLKNPSKDVNTKMFETVMRRMFAWDERMERKKKNEEEDEEVKKNRKAVKDFGQKFNLVKKTS